MARPDFPRTVLEFQARFGDEQACLVYMFDSRWPEGYICPRCKGRSAWPIATRGLWECAACHYQVSLTAGTVLHKTHTWTGFTNAFSHLKTGAPVKDKTLLLTAILADGINLGLTKMAEA